MVIRFGPQQVTDYTRIFSSLMIWLWSVEMDVLGRRLFTIFLWRMHPTENNSLVYVFFSSLPNASKWLRRREPSPNKPREEGSRGAAMGMRGWVGAAEVEAKRSFIFWLISCGPEIYGTIARRGKRNWPVWAWLGELQVSSSIQAWLVAGFDGLRHPLVLLPLLLSCQCSTSISYHCHYYFRIYIDLCRFF